MEERESKRDRKREGESARGRETERDFHNFNF